MPGGFSVRSRPDIFCWVFAGRGSRSAWLEVGGIRRSVVNRSTSSCAVAQAFEQVAQGFLLAAGAAGIWEAEEDAVPERVDQGRGDSSGMAGQALVAAVFAAWIRPRSASAIWTGQCAPG